MSLSGVSIARTAVLQIGRGKLAARGDVRLLPPLEAAAVSFDDGHSDHNPLSLQAQRMRIPPMPVAAAERGELVQTQHGVLSTARSAPSLSGDGSLEGRGAAGKGSELLLAPLPTSEQIPLPLNSRDLSCKSASENLRDEANAKFDGVNGDGVVPTTAIPVVRVSTAADAVGEVLHEEPSLKLLPCEVGHSRGESGGGDKTADKSPEHVRTNGDNKAEQPSTSGAGAGPGDGNSLPPPHANINLELNTHLIEFSANCTSKNAATCQATFAAQHSAEEVVGTADEASSATVPVEAEPQLELEFKADSSESAKTPKESRVNGRLRKLPILFKSPKRKAKLEFKEIEIDPKGAPKTTVDFLALHCILPPHQITRFKQLFEQVDVDSSNTLDKDELTQALLSMNANLTLAEVDHTMRVLELLGGTGTCFRNTDTSEIEVTFEQFATIAALSEKISSLDATTKKVANDMNFEALEMKMQRAKEIFFLHDTMNEGEIPLDQVQIILKSGRIAEEHQHQVMTRLAAQGFDSLSFFDFLAYVPLFVDIHDDIVSHTLSSEARPAISDIVNTKLIGRRWAKVAHGAGADESLGVKIAAVSIGTAEVAAAGSNNGGIFVL
jgi:Ca2+-binding EF-hand superfamily protein